MEASRTTPERLDWPYFDANHQEVYRRLNHFLTSGAIEAIGDNGVDQACKRFVRQLGEARLLDWLIASPVSDSSVIDARTLCLAREGLAYFNGIADFSFAMQGLGSMAITLGGADEIRQTVLPKVRAGEWIAAFALSEKEAGSDVAAMSCHGLSTTAT